MKNVVFIFCDELRADALGCYGNPAGPLHTPNIDRVAKRGVLFEECYCPSPVCVASRTCLMTGMWPEETGAYDNEAALPTFRLPRTVTTFPEELAKAGYVTANFGKTHFPKELHPFQVDDPEGAEMHLGLSQDVRKSLDRVIPRGGLSFNAASLYPEGLDYYPERLTQNAIDWIRQQEGPYFVRLSYNQPHSPIIVKRGYEAYYANHAFSGELPDISGLSEFEQAFAKAVNLGSLTEEEVRKAKIYYYGMVCWIDDEVGKVLSVLEERGELDNTIFIISSDHGALRGEVQGLGKHVFQRKSQQIPLIISAPGQLQPGTRRSDICSLIDLPRTLFGLLGLELPEQFHGSDLFLDPAQTYVYSTKGFGEYFSCAFPNRMMGRLPGDHGWPRRSCIRSRFYRLDMNMRIDGHEPSEDERDLFFTDCIRYPNEDVNLASDPLYADIVAEMKALLLAHGADAVEVDPASITMPKDHKSPGQ